MLERKRFLGCPALVDRLFNGGQKRDRKERDPPRWPTLQFYPCLCVLMGGGLC